MDRLIQEFQTTVSHLQEVDIGDFRRRIVLYINRLEEDLHAQGEVKKILNHMRHTVLYKTASDIEDIRESVLSLCSNIDSKL